MWEKIKEMAFNFWGIATCLFILAHLVLIEIYGAVLVYENWAWIRHSEAFMVLVFLFLGIDRIRRDW